MDGMIDCAALNSNVTAYIGDMGMDEKSLGWHVWFLGGILDTVRWIWLWCSLCGLCHGWYSCNCGWGYMQLWRFNDIGSVTWWKIKHWWGMTDILGRRLRLGINDTISSPKCRPIDRICCEISVSITWFGLRKSGRSGIGSMRESRTKESGCSCNQRI